MMVADLTVFLILCVLTALFIHGHRVKKHLHNPPGPPGLPLVGNIFDVPTQNAWLRYHELRLLYSKYPRWLEMLFSVDVFPRIPS